MRSFTMILLVALTTACQSSEKYAPDRNFYFEIVTYHNDEASIKLAEYLREQIPSRKYTITNQSGLVWPFYRALNLDEKISKDSLMPPHWYVHRMIPLKKGEQIDDDGFLVRIHVIPQPDTLPNYYVDIFRRDSTGLSLSGQSGIHYIDSTEFSSESSLYQTYLKSIIRYSFK